MGKDTLAAASAGHTLVVLHCLVTVVVAIAVVVVATVVAVKTVVHIWALVEAGTSVVAEDSFARLFWFIVAAGTEQCHMTAAGILISSCG